MNEDGYYSYREFFKKSPSLVVEWYDSETDAMGWLVINSLKGGAAGGGTRMRLGATKEEAIFLAKTMEIKFLVSGPSIGGAKSVINFDPQNPNKEGVLRRWFQRISPYLWHCYGTGGDLDVDEVREVIPITSELLGLRHPQEGIVRGNIKTNEKGYYKILSNLKRGVEMPVQLEGIPSKLFTVADMITGYGVARTLHHFYQLRGNSIEGKKLLIEGFGAVGGSSAYYLTELGAKVVGILSLGGVKGEYRWLVDPNGLNINKLLIEREGTCLPSTSPHGKNPMEFWQTNADIFVPAAASHTITLEKLDQLKNLEVKIIVGGANNPFADMKLGETEVQQMADKNFFVIPDFIANCGMARVFAYLMNEEALIEKKEIFEDVDRTIKEAMDQLLKEHYSDVGFLSHSYSCYIPHVGEKIG